jgi:hypothetical protein
VLSRPRGDDEIAVVIADYDPSLLPYFSYLMGTRYVSSRICAPHLNQFASGPTNEIREQGGVPCKGCTGWITTPSHSQCW